MSVMSGVFLGGQLSQRTSIFGLRLYVVIAAFAGASLLILLILLTLCLSCHLDRRRRRRLRRFNDNKLPQLQPQTKPKPKPNFSPNLPNYQQQQQQIQLPASVLAKAAAESGPVVYKRPKTPPPLSSSSASSDVPPPPTAASPAAQIGAGEKSGGPPRGSQLGWGQWFTLKEVEEATGGLADENIIGEGGYGVVYRGVLADNTAVAIKNLHNNKGQAEKEFRSEVEAIGRVRHKHLVKLLGYCMEGEHRMLVYEYVNNGNLEQWLYGDVGEVSPLTWDIRMKIILGTARGLAYLHEGLEPKIVHRDVKASNILLDQHWNPKLSDFGLAKHISSEKTYVSTRVMGTFGYVAPEYASTGMLNERSDVYSFGVLIMEIITGRTPVDYRRPQGEVHLVEWLKTMIGERKAEEIVDSKMPEKPSSKALKRALLLALQCIDPDSHKRPKMGNVIHMLEMDDLLIHDNRGQQASVSPHGNYSNDKQSLDKY